jgi:hypothetical protein
MKNLLSNKLTLATILFVMLALILLVVVAIHPHATSFLAIGGVIPLLGMAWPTTSTTGNGNAAVGQYQALGTGTSLLWGTNNFVPSGDVAGFLTVTKITQKPIIAFNENLPNGDGLTAGKVIGLDGIHTEIEVRDDINQPVALLTIGKWIWIQDGGGLFGTRYAKYKGIIVDAGWDAAPKTPAGRTLTLESFVLIQNI